MSDRRQHGVRMPNIAMRLMWCVRHCQWSTHNDVEFMSICRWRCFHDFFIFCMFFLLILTDFSIRCGIQVMQQTAIQTFGTSRNIDGKKNEEIRASHWLGRCEVSWHQQVRAVCNIRQKFNEDVAFHISSYRRKNRKYDAAAFHYDVRATNTKVKKDELRIEVDKNQTDNNEKNCTSYWWHRWWKSANWMVVLLMWWAHSACAPLAYISHTMGVSINSAEFSAQCFFHCGWQTRTKKTQQIKTHIE